MLQSTQVQTPWFFSSIDSTRVGGMICCVYCSFSYSLAWWCALQKNNPFEIHFMVTYNIHHAQFHGLLLNIIKIYIRSHLDQASLSASLMPSFFYNDDKNTFFDTDVMIFLLEKFV